MPVNTESVCGLDIGSNTFSFTEIARTPTGEIVFVSDNSLGVRLSEGLQPGGPLLPSAIVRGLSTIEKLVEMYDLKHKPVKAVATAVLRRTSDPSPFVTPAEEILGHPIEIVDGEEEARLTLEGATFGLPQKRDWIVLDIGGQSTEFSWRTNGKWRSISLEIGVVGLTESYLIHDPPRDDEVANMRTAVRELLEASLPADITGSLLAVAGTASSLGMLNQSMSTWKREKLHGSVMDKDALNKWMTTMISISSRERQEIYGVRPVRADVFPAGISIIEEAIRYFALDGFTISATGLRLGAALSIL